MLYHMSSLIARVSTLLSPGEGMGRGDGWEEGMDGKRTGDRKEEDRG